MIQPRWTYSTTDGHFLFKQLFLYPKIYQKDLTYKLNNPISSHFPCLVYFSRPLIIFVTLLWTLSNLSITFKKCYAPNWTQNSKWSLTSAQSGIIMFNVLDMKHLWLHPTTLLIFLEIIFSFWSSLAPRALSTLLLPSQWFTILYVSDYFFLSRWNVLHLLLKKINHSTSEYFFQFIILNTKFIFLIACKPIQVGVTYKFIKWSNNFILQTINEGIGQYWNNPSTGLLGNSLDICFQFDIK